jgi:hypothetical protein
MTRTGPFMLNLNIRKNKYIYIYFREIFLRTFWWEWKKCAQNQRTWRFKEYKFQLSLYMKRKFLFNLRQQYKQTSWKSKQRKSGHFGEKKKSHALLAKWTPHHPAHSIVTLQATLSRLLEINSYNFNMGTFQVIFIEWPLNWRQSIVL